MDFVSFPSFYLSAPTSPFGCSPRSSPVPPFGSCSSAVKTSDDDFQFETGWDKEEHEYRLPARVSSCSTFAFADELFSSGQVLPLKLPPRLQTSVPTSPTRSFPQRCPRNYGFDPFMVALEKVSEETEGRMSVHRRSRSYSPFRMRTITDRRAPCNGFGGKPWLRAHNEAMKQTEAASCKESKMKKVKSVLLRYVSLKKEIGESKQTREIITVSKASYFKQFSLSFRINRRKKGSADGKMALV